MYLVARRTASIATSKQSPGVDEAMTGIGSLSQEHVESLGEIHDSVRVLSQGADELREQVALFRELDDLDSPVPEDQNLKLID